MRLLIAEDEEQLNRIITDKLTEDGYAVDSCYDGDEALDYLESAEYDGVILDVMMPHKDGFEVLRRMRERGINTPVLFLTARDAVADKVSGLDAGAQDYLVKPFSFDELTARIRAMIRNTASGRVTPNATSVLTVADLTVDTATHEVMRGGRRIELSSREYSMLVYMMHNAGIVLSREKIEDHIWNFDYEGGTNVVDVYISYLRRKIDDNSDKKLIHTVRGSGYVIREA